MQPVRSALFFGCLALLLYGAGRAQAGYGVQPIAKGGDRADDFTLSRCSGRCTDVLALNDAGETCFVSWLADGQAVYLMKPDGGLSPVLKTGAATSLGTVTGFPLTLGFANGIALNGKGQIAVPVTFEAGGSPTDVVTLLTPQ